MVVQVPLSRGLCALVDEEDYELVSKISWHADPGPRGKLYARGPIWEGGAWRIHRMHRFIMGLPRGRNPVVDHIDNDGLNNTRANLRLASPTENSCNRGPVSGHKYKGVYFRRGSWCAGIGFGNRTIWLGRYGSEVEAAAAYDVAALQYHGEFAKLNFPIVPREPREPREPRAENCALSLQVQSIPGAAHSNSAHANTSNANIIALEGIQGAERSKASPTIRFPEFSEHGNR